MRKDAFLKRLEMLLSEISAEEREEAMAFYRGYFEDAGEENEETILAELGSPENVAETIKRDLEMVDMSAAMGNIDFSGKVKGDMTAQVDMGSIEVELEGNKEDYNIQLSTEVGNVKFDGKKQENSFDVYHGNAQFYVVLNCDMGDVELSYD